MDQKRIDAVARFVSGVRSRRTVLRGLAGAGFGAGLPRLSPGAEAKQRKPKSKKGLCQKNGSPCKKPGKQCKRQYCLRAPFTIEARWTEEADHESYLFVPPKDETTGPAPHIYAFCNPGNSRCDVAYPFACVNDDSTTGPEITTISQLLPGTYEYWVELYDTTLAGEVTVVLKDKTGRVVRTWTSPANPLEQQAGWHVFDVDGRGGRVTSVDVRVEAKAGLPDDAYDPHTLVCPYNA